MTASSNLFTEQAECGARNTRMQVRNLQCAIGAINTKNPDWKLGVITFLHGSDTKAQSLVIILLLGMLPLFIKGGRIKSDNRRFLA